MIITEVHEGMLDQVRSFLISRKEFGFERNWDPVFQYRWKLPQFPYGYAIVNGEKVVGFLGTMYAERLIEGEKKIFCNLSTWIVDEESKGARSLAVALIFPPMKKKLTVTCYTANAIAQRCFEKIGFKRLDDHQVIVPLIPGASRLRAKDSPNLLFEPEAIKSNLGDVDRVIFDDHQGLKCAQFLIQEKATKQYCYGLGTTNTFQSRVLSGWNCFNICYLSNAEVFGRNFSFLSKHLRKRWNAAVLRYDSRLIPHSISRLQYKMPTVRYWFGADSLRAQDIDNLYSELVTYNKY